jgi:hypothetical protein
MLFDTATVSFVTLLIATCLLQGALISSNNDGVRSHLEDTVGKLDASKRLESLISVRLADRVCRSKAIKSFIHGVRQCDL